MPRGQVYAARTPRQIRRTPPRGLFGYSVHMTRVHKSMLNGLTAQSSNLAASPAANFMDAVGSARGTRP